MFHEVKGRNVTLDPSYQVATWHPTRTGGCLFTAQPLCETQTVRLTLSGSGGVELGVVGQDPSTLSEASLVSSTLINGYQFLNDVKIHKRSCILQFAVNMNTQEVSSSYGEGHYSQPIQPGRSYWLAIDVKYGEVELKLLNQENDNCGQRFSTVHGNNIQLFNDPTVAKSCQRSPAALCIYKHKLHKELNLNLHCTPQPHQGMVPGRYYVTVLYATSSPQQLQQGNPDLLDVGCKRLNQDPLNKVERFEKEECTGGPVQLTVTGSDLVYTSSTGKVNTQPGILEPHKDTWLVFELYGVQLKLSTTSNASGTFLPAGYKPAGRNVPDALALHARQNSAAFLDVSEEPLDITPEQDRVPEQSFTNIPRADNISLERESYASNQASLSPDTQGCQDLDDTHNFARSIQKSWTKLIDSFVAKEYVDLMYEEDLLTMGQMEELHRLGCPARNVLQFLSKRPIRKKFMRMALEKTKQGHLECYFFPEHEKE